MSWSQSDAGIKSPSNAEKAIKSNCAPAPQHNLHVRAENEQGSAKPVCLKRVSRLLTLNFFEFWLVWNSCNPFTFVSVCDIAIVTAVA